MTIWRWDDAENHQNPEGKGSAGSERAAGLRPARRYGTPPGGGRAYRATIYVQDPALDARSLKVSLVSKSGPVDAATVRAVEDAILTRARQLRIRDGKL